MLTALTSSETNSCRWAVPHFFNSRVLEIEGVEGGDLEERSLELSCVCFCSISHAAGEVHMMVDGEGLDEREMNQERFKDKMGSIRHKKKLDFFLLLMLNQ